MKFLIHLIHFQFLLSCILELFQLIEVINMNNLFKDLPWSTIRILRYIVKSYNLGTPVDSLKIRKHFKLEVGKEQPTLELLKHYKYIDSVNGFYKGPGIYQFRITAKALSSFESFGENLIVFFLSSCIIPTIVSIVTTVIVNVLIKR